MVRGEKKFVNHWTKPSRLPFCVFIHKYFMLREEPQLIIEYCHANPFGIFVMLSINLKSEWNAVFVATHTTDRETTKRAVNTPRESLSENTTLVISQIYPNNSWANWQKFVYPLAGQTITVSVEITAHHKGYFEFTQTNAPPENASTGMCASVCAHLCPCLVNTLPWSAISIMLNSK